MQVTLGYPDVTRARMVGRCLAMASMELRTELTHHACRFEVRDRGPGIAIADVDRLFEPFERGAGGEGMGMGLAVVGAIARAHHGSANARRDGAETVFSIEVPR